MGILAGATPAEQANAANLAMLRAQASAATYKKQRDQLVKQLRTQDPTYWTYTRLAAAVGITVYAVTKIIKTT